MVEATVFKVVAHARDTVLELTLLVIDDLEGTDREVRQAHWVMHALDVVLFEAGEHRCNTLIVLIKDELLANVLVMVVADFDGGCLVVLLCGFARLDEERDLVAHLLYA